MAHAVYSPSGFERWGNCPASISVTKDLPRSSSVYSREGTCAHEVAALALIERKPAKEYLGRVFHVEGQDFEIDVEMADYVQVYLDLVNSFGGQLLVEQRLPISSITGEPEAHGTADAVIFRGTELIIADLKFGRGARVDAEDNSQLKIYANAALSHYDWAGPFTSVRLVICQPRLDHISEWEIDDVNGLIAWTDVVRAAVVAAESQNPKFVPGEDQCRFCGFSSQCVALAEFVYASIAGEFVDLDNPQLDFALGNSLTNSQLSGAMKAIPVIEIWIKSIAERVHTALQNGEDIPDFKLVGGRRGARRWINDADVMALLAAADIPSETYLTNSLISPTALEKVLRETPLWSALTQNHIAQTQGKPSVALASDPRPALSNFELFEDLSS
jgi:hypothetical protein